MTRTPTDGDAAELGQLIEDLLIAILRMSAAPKVGSSDATATVMAEHAKIHTITRRIREILG